MEQVRVKNFVPNKKET